MVVFLVFKIGGKDALSYYSLSGPALWGSKETAYPFKLASDAHEVASGMRLSSPPGESVGVLSS